MQNKEKTLKKNVTAVEKEFADIEKKLNTLQKQVGQTLGELDKASSRVQALELEEQETNRKQHSLETRQEGQQNQIQFYENLLESKEGYPGGVKYVLKDRKSVV